LLTGSKGRAFVEAKSATMLASDGEVAFPDSVTERGTKHLLELERLVQEGERAVLLFCVNRDDARFVRAAHEIDPVYAKTLERVVQSGVEVIAYTGEISTAGYRLERPVPFQFHSS
jgi:sugar fermentation stimulation protein A